jgi:hypothetical protein
MDYVDILLRERDAAASCIARRCIQFPYLSSRAYVEVIQTHVDAVFCQPIRSNANRLMNSGEIFCATTVESQRARFHVDTQAWIGWTDKAGRLVNASLQTCCTSANGKMGASQNRHIMFGGVGNGPAKCYDERNCYASEVHGSS